VILALIVLMTPLCAATAGVLVWVGHRGESLDDGVLLRKFLIALAIVMALLWTIARTDAVRMRWDSQYRTQAEIETNPVYSAVKRTDPHGGRWLRAFLDQQLAAGTTLPQALLKARPLLTSAVTERLGFADQSSKLVWGGLVADSLQELNDANPDLCYRVMAGQSLDEVTVVHAFSAENTARFQQAVVRVYESANRGMRREFPPEDKPVNLSAAQLEFSAIQVEVEQQFGRSVAAQVAGKSFPASPSDPAEQLCSARIFQLHEILKRPTAMASKLIDGVLR
jgi:hypothetical protein